MGLNNGFKRIATATAATATSGALIVGVIAAPAHAAQPDPEAQLIQQLRGTADSVKTGALPDILTRLTSRLATTEDANARIAARLPTRSQHKEIGSNFAVNVVDVASGDQIWSYRPTAALLPASNMKIITAVNALRAMGPDKRFTTQVYSLGRGKVLLVGGGDATLGSTGITKLAKKAAKKISADPALVPNLVQPKPYRPSTCVRKGKTVKSTKKRPCPLVTPAPRRQVKVFVDDSLYPTPTRGPGWTGGHEPSVVRPVRALAIDGDYSMDAAANAGAMLANALRKRGLYGIYKAHRTNHAGTTLLSSYTGARLADQLSYMLQVSENNVAEMMYRNTAIAKGYYPTWQNSEKAALDSLQDLGVPTAGLALKDGSGVSRSDRMTTVTETGLLSNIADRTNHPELESIYYGGSLPLAGRTGTLSASTGRYTTSPTSCAAGRIRAKTGTLFDTVALSGLTVGTDGKLKAFSIIVNSRPQKYTPLQTRRMVDRIATTVNGCW